MAMTPEQFIADYVQWDLPNIAKPEQIGWDGRGIPTFTLTPMDADAFLLDVIRKWEEKKNG